MGRFRRAGSQELTLQELRSIATQMHWNGAHTANFFGGEPTVRADLFDILRVFSPLFPCVEMDTNGRVIDDAYARELRRAGLTAVYVSLHGARPSTHATISGDDSHQFALRALHASIAAGIETNVSAVVTRDMARSGELPELIALARKSGASGVRLLYPALSGRWSHEKDVLLTEDDKRTIAPLIDGDYVHVEVRGFKTYTCYSVFGGFFYVSPYGEVLPCNFVPLALGDLRREPLAAIVRRSIDDIPWLRDDPAFNPKSKRCIMLELRAIDIFGGSKGPLTYAKFDNHVDLGGGAIGDERPTRSLDDIEAALRQVAEKGHRRVHLFGGDLPSRVDAQSVAQLVADVNLSADLVCDVRSLVSPDAAGLLATLGLRRVRVPVNVGTAPTELGIPLALGSVPTLSQAIGQLRERSISTDLELLVAAGSPAPDRTLLTELLAAAPGEVSIVHIADGPASTERQEALGAHLPALSGHGHHVTHRECIASDQQLSPDLDDLPGTVLAPENAFKLGERLSSALSSGPRGQTFVVSATRRGLTGVLDAVEPLLPQLESGDHRLLLRRVGLLDVPNERGLDDLHELVAEAHSEPHQRLFQLEKRSEASPSKTLRAFGFGLKLFQPWTTAEDLAALLGPPPQDESPERKKLRETLLVHALLRDADPPAIDDETPSAWTPAAVWSSDDAWSRGAWPQRAYGWRFHDARLSRLYRLFVAAALARTGLPLGPLEGDPDARAMCETFERLPADTRQLPVLLSALTANFAELGDDGDAHEFLERCFGPWSDSPESSPTPEDTGRAGGDAERWGFSSPLSDDERVVLAAESAVVALARGYLHWCDGDDWSAASGGGYEQGNVHGLRIRLSRAASTVTLNVFPATTPGPALFEGSLIKLRTGTSASNEHAGDAVLRSLPKLGAAIERYFAGGDDADVDSVLGECLPERAPALNGSSGRRSPSAESLAANTPLVRRIAERLGSAPRSPLPGCALVSFEAADEQQGFELRLGFVRGASQFSLVVLPGDDPRPGAAEGKHVRVQYASDPMGRSDVPSPKELHQLCRLLDHYLSRART